MALAKMTREQMVCHAVMLKHTGRSRDSLEGIKKGIGLKKKRVLGWRKAGYVLLHNECEAERERDDGLGFHSCARNNLATVGFRTKAGPIACGPEETPYRDSAVEERTGWTPWSRQ